MSEAPNALCDQLLVDFPTRRRPSVRFAPSATVQPVRSTLTMICHKEELWYSKRDEAAMKVQRKIDVITLRRAILAHSAEDIKGGAVHVSQVAGLEEALDPTEAKSK